MKSNHVLYSIDYIARNIFSGSAVAFIPIFFSLVIFRGFEGRKSPTLFAIIGVALYCAFAFLASDVFPNGRMFLTPMALMLLVYSKNNCDGHVEDGFNFPQSFMNWLNFFTILRRFNSINPLAFIIFLLISLSIFPNIKNNISAAVQLPLQAKFSATVEQLVISKYIRNKFIPSDGAIGLFYLGTVSFYLPNFEVADFLGKANEDIAKTPVKWGPPGHNK